MNLFRYTFTWIASTFTALLLCFMALHILSIRSALIEQSQQQLHSSFAYFEQRLGLSDISAPPTEANYTMLLEQLGRFSPRVETQLLVLASNQSFSSPPLRQSIQTASQPHFFWPALSMQRTLFANSAQAIRFTATIPVGTVTAVNRIA